ncbi:hypothetical protein DM02DRAFT_385694 [Periconia macrospinosa]|uniref:Uncharacterized protein n=1 Tax=Periconia macrospinosa TaxID=97972 RepID=A0A2V1DV64_9PLEO|nr:hypothetical protein DM02DRAFT_385694 [Periconia macrospinosa]
MDDGAQCTGSCTVQWMAIDDDYGRAGRTKYGAGRDRVYLNDKWMHAVQSRSRPARILCLLRGADCSHQCCSPHRKSPRQTLTGRRTLTRVCPSQRGVACPSQSRLLTDHGTLVEWLLWERQYPACGRIGAVRNIPTTNYVRACYMPCHAMPCYADEGDGHACA